MIEILKESEFSPSGKAKCVVDGTEVEYSLLLPEQVFKTYPKNIQVLNPIQTVFCLYYRGGSALVSSSTSSGKTLIAAYFLLKNKHINDTDFQVYVVPTRALARDVYKSLEQFMPGESMVHLLGDEDIRPRNKKIIITTYEAALSAIRNNVRWGRYSALVVDEFHLILNNRGPLIEEIVSASLYRGASILGLSGTLPDSSTAAKWIKAGVHIVSGWRPVPLKRQWVVGQDYKSFIEGILNNNMRKTIVFVGKKKEGWKLLKTFLSDYSCVNQTLPFDIPENGISEKKGKVAFHCADVPYEEQKEIADRFINSDDFNVLIATHTLAYGINLPVDTVAVKIERSYLPDVDSVNRMVVWPSSLDIMQMEGRAGRYGLRKQGESYLFVQAKSQRAYQNIRNEIISAMSCKFKPYLLKLINSSGVQNTDVLDSCILPAFLYDAPAEFLSNSYTLARCKQEISTRLMELKKRGFLSDGKLTAKGLFTVKTQSTPNRVDSFLNRMQIGDCMLINIVPLLGKEYQLEGVFIDKDTLKHVLSSTIFRPVRKALEKYLNVDSYVFDNETIPSTMNILYYIYGVFYHFERVHNIPSPFSWLKQDCIHIERSLKQARALGLVNVSDSSIEETITSLKKGIPPEWLCLSKLQGAGYMTLHAIIRMLMYLGVSKVETLSDLYSVLLNINDRLKKEAVDYSLSIRYSKKQDIEKFKNKILSVLENNCSGYM